LKEINDKYNRELSEIFGRNPIKSNNLAVFVFLPDYTVIVDRRKSGFTVAKTFISTVTISGKIVFKTECCNEGQ
jgi:hypothetical protein